MCVCVCVCVCAIPTYLCMYVICMYVHMCVRMCVCVIDGGMEVVLVSKPFSAEAGCSDWVMLLQLCHNYCL